MPIRRRGFAAFLLILGFGLSGCLQSRAPLFDEARAVTPAPAGRYEEQESKLGQWVVKQAGTLTIENRSYSWKIDGDKGGAEFFTLQDIGGGFYIAAARKKNPSPKDPYTYALFEAVKEGYLAYMPTCSNLMRVRLPSGDAPEIDGGDCFFKDRDTLVRVLRRYADVMNPSARYVPVKPSENKP
jgi:hypothetical protein